MEVLFDNTGARVDHKYDHVGILYRLQRFNHREFFYGLARASTLANTCCINQGITLAATFEWNINTVTRCAGLVIDNNTIFAEHAVYQSRFAYVRATCNGDFYAGDGNIIDIEIVFGFFFFSDFGKLFKYA